MKRAKWFIWVFLLVFAVTGCYWTAEEGGLVLSVGLPKELEAKGDSVYYATLIFESTDGGDDFTGVLAMPSFQDSRDSQGTISLKLPEGEYNFQMLLDLDGTTKFTSGEEPIPVYVPWFGRAKYSVSLVPY